MTYNVCAATRETHTALSHVSAIGLPFSPHMKRESMTAQRYKRRKSNGCMGVGCRHSTVDIG